MSPTDGAILRPIEPHDLPALTELARALDSVNLPADRSVLSELIAASTASFARERPVAERVFVFVLDTASGIAGTSTIYAQHGTPDLPHIAFHLRERELYSETLEQHRRETFVQIAFTYDGPTELGGLVVDPSRRGLGSPGRQLSLARLLFLGLNRSLFRPRLLAELMPRLEHDGSSRLWEHLGQRFTGLSYREADRLSRENKEFIVGLFPPEPIYLGFLPDEVRRELGEVGAATQPARAMLEELGFEFRGAIDPFDGGPHLWAETDDVLGRLRFAVHRVGAAAGGDERELLIAPKRAPFRAMRAHAAVDGPCISLAAGVCDRLGVREGDEVASIAWRPSPG